MTNEATLEEKEAHPSAYHAMEWYRKWKQEKGIKYLQIREAIASTALSGNRIAEICNSTLDRLDKGEMVSDRYLLGLCWFLRDNF